MKLIIDIDKELKSAVYRCGLFLNPTEKTSLIDAINNGTPIPDNATVCDIEQIRDEIKGLSYPYNLDAMRTKSDVLQIIDKYIKAERR